MRSLPGTSFVLDKDGRLVFKVANMNRQVIWPLGAVLVLLAVLVFPHESQEEESSAAPPAGSTQPVQMPSSTASVHTDLASSEALPPTPPEPLPAPEVSPELRALFTKLRNTFGAYGSKPNRFRLQRHLSELWGDDPPVDILLFEASDPEAPAEYRAHFAARLRNLGKTTPPEEREELARAMRESLAMQPQGNPKLAQALLAFDDHSASIRVVSKPLESSLPDDTTAGLLAALALSGSSESRRLRLEHTRALSADPDRFRRSLQTALPPLALRPELEVDPILQRVLATTSDFLLCETAVQSCFYRPPGSASIAALQAAFDRRTEFAPREQERLTQRLRAGLLRWSRQAAPSHPSTQADITALLNQLP